jgi:hypothetical protein
MRNFFAEPEEMVVTHAPWEAFVRHNRSIFSFVNISVDTKSHGVQRVQWRYSESYQGAPFDLITSCLHLMNWLSIFL